MNGMFEDFLAALLAFESGWDRERYDAGVIVDSQLNQWAGGTVEDFYPQYSSWSQLSNAEWLSMAYRSTNTFGFVGYQFGEALLIDLGYYDDDFYYGNGASSNTWDGTWTGKNGVDSLEEFMTQEAQDVAIREAFGHNLTVIQNLLAANGESVEDYIGQSVSYTYSGGSGSVELTLTGILAGAHLRGAPAVVDLLRSGSVSIDEYGTSILQYIEQFGGYDSPSVDSLITYFEDRLTGDEGLEPGSGNGGGAGVTPETADVVVDWAWGTHTTVDDFDTDAGTIFVGWFTSAHLEVSEQGGNVVFSIPSNNQSVTLVGVSLSDLDADNFTFLDATAATEILALVGGSGGGGDTDGGGVTDTGGGDSDGGDTDGGDTGGGNTDGSDTDGGDIGGGGTGGGTPVAGNGTAGVTKDTASVVITWAWGNDTIVDDFDPATDTIFVDWFGPEAIDVSESGGNIVFSMPSNQQTVTLAGIQLDDLSAANFTIMSEATAQEILGQVAMDTGGHGGHGGHGGSGDGDPGGETAIVYDNDGSAPPATLNTTDAGGVIYEANYQRDDIVGFDVARDVLSVGNTSVHSMVINRTPEGEVIVDNPWGSGMQILQGVMLSDMSVENFGVVGNEHFRQDLGAVLSWEMGVGPREADTVYIRSHEYGVHEVIDDFDPLTMKISFLYFGTRERLSVEDTDQGLVISSSPSGQSFTFTGITLADLHPGTLEFHFDQVMEDQLEVPFGFSQGDVALVSREALLTPEAPAGEITDGHQTRDGVFWTADPGDGDPDDGAGDGGDTPDDSTPPDNDTPDTGGAGDGEDIYTLSWNWAAIETIADFDPTEDVLNFGALSTEHVDVSEVGSDLVIEVLNNGGHQYILSGIQAEDLQRENLTAPDWSDVLDGPNGVIAQLTDLGYMDIA